MGRMEQNDIGGTISTATFSKHHRGGGGLMVWDGISWRGKTPLIFLRSMMVG